VPASPATLVDLADPTGDQGKDGPAYADGLRLQLESSGDQLTATVTMAATLPAKLASSEVMGIGVDLYRPGGSESDYQLFADGEPDGWYAYLDTPTGFTRYPGTFDLVQSRVVFTVPWSALGDIRSGQTSAFVDWSRNGATTSVASADHIPDAGRVSFSR